jgi:hypothetical protein
MQELQSSQTVDDSSQPHPENLPDRARRQTFTNAQGMSKLTYIVNKCRLCVSKGWNKICNKVLFCGTRSESSDESGSTDLTIPPNTRASTSSDETQVAGRVSPEPATVPRPPIRNGPGTNYTEAHFITFPAFLAGDIEQSELEIASQTNMGSPPAASPSARNVAGPSRAAGYSTFN